MMKTVKHTFNSIGDRSGDFARTIGSGTVDLAKRVGDGSVSVARRIGPRNALIGLAVAAVAIGGSIVLIRYLRSRDVEGLENESGESSGRSSNRRRSRGQRNTETQVSQQG